MGAGDPQSLTEVPFVLGGNRRIQTKRYTATAAGTDAAIITAGASQRAVVTQVLATLSNAYSGTACAVRVGFGTATTPTTDGVVASHAGLAKGGGFARGNGDGVIGVGEASEDVRVTHDAPTDGALDIVITYFFVNNQ